LVYDVRVTNYSGDTPLTRFLAMQTLTQLREMKAEARNEIEAARARVAELERDLARIEQAISEKAGGRARTPPTGADSHVNGRGTVLRAPSHKQAILQVMTERPNQVWSTQEVYDELLRRGNAPQGAKPLNTVGSRLNEMAHGGVIYRVGRGAYTLQPPYESRPSLLPPTEDGETD
jgi:hypothetical protein